MLAVTSGASPTLPQFPLPWLSHTGIQKSVNAKIAQIESNSSTVNERAEVLRLQVLRSFAPSLLRSFAPSLLRSFAPSLLRSFALDWYYRHTILYYWHYHWAIKLSFCNFNITFIFQNETLENENRSLRKKCGDQAGLIKRLEATPAIPTSTNSTKSRPSPVRTCPPADVFYPITLFGGDQNDH